MPVITEIMWSEFSNGGAIQGTDKLVGLRSSNNVLLDAPSGGGSNMTFVNKASDQLFINGAAAIVTGFSFTPQANKTYLLKGYFSVVYHDAATVLNIGFTNDATLSSSNTLVLVAGHAFREDATAGIIRRYTSQAYGFDNDLAFPVAPNLSVPYMHEISIVFSTGVSIANCLFWLTATEATGATLKAGSTFVISDVSG